MNPTAWFTDKLAELQTSKPWTAISVRRGDYLTTPGMGIVEDSYYVKAMSLISKLNATETFYVFSDDPEAAQQLPALRSIPRRSFITPPKESPAIESLVLQSPAHNVVLSNSTFAWWGAWLGDSEGRVVTYPYPWGDFHSVNDRDRHLPNWIGLGRETLEQAAKNNALFPDS